MTNILCRWLNEELRLSQVIEPKTCARDFSSGYLIGEILYKYHLQNDFDMFIKNNNSTSKVSNFHRLEPTLQSLGISFDGAIYQELMQEKQGAATHLLYQLYVTLGEKKKSDIRENVPAAAAARLLKKEQDVYFDGLHKGVNANMKLRISHNYQVKGHQMNHKSVEASAAQQKKSLPSPDKKIKRNMYMEHSQSMPHHQTTTVQVPKSAKNQQHQRKEKQGKILQNELDQFETNTRKLVTFTLRDFLPEEYSPQNEAHGVKAQSMQSSCQYVQQIRQRLEEDTFAQEQRKKREAWFLVEQLRARRAEQDTQYNESLVKRLTRQTKEEERMVTHLLKIRSQKEVLLKNRLFREQQIQQRREKDFEEALEREAALVRQERLDRAEEIRRELDFCKRLSGEREQNRHKKHFESCKEIVREIVDLATKVGEYRLLTGNLIPGKQMREWKELLISGLPLYETLNEKVDQKDKQLDPTELMKQDTLNDREYDEYRNMVGEWAGPQEAGRTKLPSTNGILGHVMMQLRNIVHAPAVELSVLPLHHFSLKACVLGKVCSGKTTCLAKITKAHGFYVLSTDKLVKEALDAHQNREELSARAMFGAAADKEMREGKAISNELLVDIIAEAIRHIPANSGWILDGFPVDITQAYLLEKALGGTVNEVYSNQTDLAEDPKPPKAPTSAPALDLALLLEISDECAASRAANQTDEHNLAVISNRIAAFQETWSDLEEWFGAKQNILVRVNANVDEEELLKTVTSVLQQIQKQPPQGPLRKPSLPNDNSFLCVDEPLPPGLAASLCLHWDTLSKSYESKIKAVLQELRLQHATIDLHLFNIREEFECYVGRPDLKQDLISQWRKEFNNTPLDMGEEEETKAKLHQRLDDLLEQLWDISDKREEDNELKMAAVMEDGWLLDQSAVLLNHHSTLIQVELDRFQDTVSILKTYYLSMYRQTLGISIPLLATVDEEVIEKSDEPPTATMYIQMEGEKGKSANGLIIAKTQSQGHTEIDKPQCENFISDYEVALTVINNLKLSEVRQWETETKQPKEGGKEKKPSASTDKNGSPSPNQASSHEPADITPMGSTITDRAVRNKIYNEYVAALNQEEDAAKVRIALIKGHGLVMVDSLQSRAEKTFSSMRKLVKEHFVAEMKSIDQLAEVVRHHIQSDPKLQKELVLDCAHHYQNRDGQMRSTPSLTSQPVRNAQ